MNEFIPYINKILALGTVAADVFIVWWFLMYFFAKQDLSFVKFNKIAQEYSLLIGAGIAFFSIIASLFYSDIINYAPCVLCWYQRVLIYPQAIILGMAWKKKDANAASYSFVMSVLGAIIALYNHYLQLGGRSLLPCGAPGVSASCAQRFVFEFGFVSIPFMSFTAFLLLIVFSIILIKREEWNKA